MVHSNRTRCGISLKGKQKLLHYYQNDHQICPTCKAKNIPQFRNWNRNKSIKDGLQAEMLLSRLHILFNMIHQNQRVGLGIHLCAIGGSTSISNWLDNPNAKIEERLEDEKKLRIGYPQKGVKEERLISYGTIAKCYNEVLESVLATMQNRTN